MCPRLNTATRYTWWREEDPHHELLCGLRESDGYNGPLDSMDRGGSTRL